MTADRNRPEHLSTDIDRPDYLGDEMRKALTEAFAAKKPPAEVAELVLDAILTKRFWVFTDEQFVGPVAERHRSIDDATNPEKAGLLSDYLLG